MRKGVDAMSVRPPSVSVIINNYNYGRFLREAIDSALNQTYPDIEVIVVDDGSTDNSYDVIDSYEDRITPVLKDNGGQASAFNAGFTVSRGEIVMFLDADDYLFSHAVERVAAVWKQGVAEVHYRLEVVDAVGNAHGYLPPHEKRLDSGAVWQILLKRGSYITSVTSGMGFSRAVLGQILPVPEAEFRISADGYLATLAPFFGQVRSIEEALGAYRQHGSNRWDYNEVSSERFRQSVHHDLQKQALLTCKGAELGYKLPRDMGLRDYAQVQARIVSLRLDPEKHPVPSDHTLRLVHRGLYAIWRYSELNWKERLVFSAWFVWVGFLPLSLARPAISWLLVRRSRPEALTWIIKKLAPLMRR